MPSAEKTEEAKKPPKPKKKVQVPADGSKTGTRSVLRPPACSENCFVGLLDKHATTAFKAELADRGVATKPPPKGSTAKEPTAEEAAAGYIDQVLSLDTEELHMNLFGLRRKNSVTNVFDDVVVMLFRVPSTEGDAFVIPQTPRGGFVPEQGSADGPRRTINEEAAKAFVAAVDAADKEEGFPKCGDEVHCPVHGYWRVVAFANTTDPGYGPGSDKSSHDLRVFPWGIAAAETGQFLYRVGFHHFSKFNGYVAGQAVTGVPAKRRYPVVKPLRAAQAEGQLARRKALKAAAGKSKDEIKKLADEQAKKRALDELPILPKPDGNKKKRAAAEEKYKPEEFDAECERRFPEAALQAERKAQHAELNRWFFGKDGGRTVDGAIVRLEEYSGSSKRDFEKEKTKSVKLRIDPAPAADGAFASAPRVVLDVESAEGKASVLELTDDDVLVTRTTAAGTNFHRSVDRLKGGAKRSAKGRTVQNFSEGCQVFRDPDDFYKALRLLQLSKRVRCTARSSTCTDPVTLDEYRKHASLGGEFDEGMIEDEARADLLDSVPLPGHAEKDPAPEVKPPIESLRKGTLGAVQAAVKSVLGKKTLKPGEATISKIVEALLRQASRAPIDDAEPEPKPPPKTPPKTPPKPGSNEEKAAAKAKEKEKTAAVAAAAGAAVSAEQTAWQAELTKVRDAWVEKNREPKQKERLAVLVGDHAEHCDFAWACKTYFPYTLVELGEPEIRELLGKLPSYKYEKLFPAGAVDKINGPAEKPQDGDDP